MDILKGLTTTLVEYFQAPIPAGRVRGPGLAAAAGGDQSPDEEGSSEALHGEGLCAANGNNGPSNKGLRGGSSSPLITRVTCSVSFLIFHALGNRCEKQKAVPRGI